MLFVSNYGDDTVSVLDPETGRERAIIEVGESPLGLDVRYEPKPAVAVANSTGNQITLIDPVRLSIAGRIPAGKGPTDVAFSRDGTKLHSTSPYDRTVDTFSVADGQRVGEPIELSGGKPTRILLSPDGTRLFVLVTALEGQVAVIDTNERKVLKTIPVGPYPKDITMLPDGSRVFASSFDFDKVTAIDGATLEIVATYEMGTGEGLLAHPRKPLLYAMTAGFNEVNVFDYEKRETVAVLELGEWPTRSAITPDGRFLFLVHEDSDNVVKVDTSTNEMVQRMAVGKNPGDALFVRPLGG